MKHSRIPSTLLCDSSYRTLLGLLSMSRCHLVDYGQRKRAPRWLRGLGGEYLRQLTSLDQEQFLSVDRAFRFHSDEIEPASHCQTLLILAVPDDFVHPRRQLLICQESHPLTQQIVHHQAHLHRSWERDGKNGPYVERIGIAVTKRGRFRYCGFLCRSRLALA